MDPTPARKGPATVLRFRRGTSRGTRCLPGARSWRTYPSRGSRSQTQIAWIAKHVTREIVDYLGLVHSHLEQRSVEYLLALIHQGLSDLLADARAFESKVFR